MKTQNFSKAFILVAYILNAEQSMWEKSNGHFIHFLRLSPARLHLRQLFGRRLRWDRSSRTPFTIKCCPTTAVQTEQLVFWMFAWKPHTMRTHHSALTHPDGQPGEIGWWLNFKFKMNSSCKTSFNPEKSAWSSITAFHYTLEKKYFKAAGILKPAFINIFDC